MEPMELIDKRALMRTLKISDNCNGCEWERGPLCGRANKDSFVEACEAICEAPVLMTVDETDAWNALSRIYNMKGLPDEVYSIIGDVMLELDGVLVRKIDEFDFSKLEPTIIKEGKADPSDLQMAVNIMEDFARFAADCGNETCKKMAKAIGSAIEDMASIYLTQLMSKLDRPEGEEVLKQEEGTE